MHIDYSTSSASINLKLTQKKSIFKKKMRKHKRHTIGKLYRNQGGRSLAKSNVTVNNVPQYTE